jgi:hypothetical protein
MKHAGQGAIEHRLFGQDPTGETADRDRTWTEW